MTARNHIIQESDKQRRRALMLGVQLADESDEDITRSLEELKLLANTLGIEVVGSEVQRRRSREAAMLFGSGKLTQIARMTGGPGPDPEEQSLNDLDELDEDEPESDDDEPGGASAAAGPRVDLVLVDSELSARQQRILERALGVEVIDRAGVILQIFERRAQTREARLEVEIARLRYEMPRLREYAQSDDRRGGGGGGGGGYGGRGGRGHTNLELMRQRSRDRIAELTRELAQVQASESSRREQREETFQAVLVGYTNAGKSTLMRALTASDVLVEDKLFATLGTTVRRLTPEVTPQILVSDTVGFITNLPHELVASFRSTLDEARLGDLLLIVVDVSDSRWRDQLRVTRETLKSISADEIPTQVLLNKVDRLDESERRLLRAEMPEAMQISARDEASVDWIREVIIERQNQVLKEQTMLIPFKKGHILGEIREGARVIEEKYTAEGTTLTLLARPESLARWESLLEH